MKLKKMIIFVLCSTFILLLLTGCQSSNNSGKSTDNQEQTDDGNNSSVDISDMKTVKLVLPSAGNVSDSGSVEAAINDVLAEKYNIQVELTYIELGVYNEQLNLMLTGANEVDIFLVYGAPLTTFANNGQLLVLDEYYENSSKEFKAVWEEEVINSTRVGGTLYAITNFRNFANKYTISMNEEIVKELGINPEEINTMEKAEELLYTVKEKYPDIYPLVPQSSDRMVTGWSWDGLGDEKYIGVLEDFGQDLEVKNLFKTDDFVSFVTTMRDWYNNGLIMSDSLSNTESGITLVQNNKAFAFLQNATPSNRTGIVKATILDAWTASNNMAGMCYAIASNTTRGDESWTLLEAMYTDAEISSLLINGVEGEHWNYTDENKNRINYPEGVDASNSVYDCGVYYFLYPNARLTVPWAPSSADFYKELDEFNNTALISKASGFTFDSVNVTNEYTACINIMDKYYNALVCGAIDPETTIPQALVEFEAAGIDLIIEEKQAQLNAFLN